MGYRRRYFAAALQCAAAFIFIALPAAGAGNLLTNPDFDTNADGWPDPYPNPETVITRDGTLDRFDPTSSGVLKLQTSISNNTSDGPQQCVPLTPGSYVARASIMIPTQSNPPNSALIQVTPYEDSGCVLSLGGSQSVWLSSNSADVWHDLESTITVPSGAASVTFRLFSGGTSDPTVATAYFDALYLPEPGAETEAIASLATLVALALARRRRCRAG